MQKISSMAGTYQRARKNENLNWLNSALAPNDVKPLESQIRPKQG